MNKFKDQLDTTEKEKVTNLKLVGELRSLRLPSRYRRRSTRLNTRPLFDLFQKVHEKCNAENALSESNSEQEGEEGLSALISLISSQLIPIPAPITLLTPTALLFRIIHSSCPHGISKYYAASNSIPHSRMRYHPSVSSL